MKRILLEQLLADQAAKRPVALLTRLADGHQALIHETDSVQDFEPALIERVRQALRADRSETVEGVFIRVFNPPLRLIVLGAVHIAQALIPMARLTGYAVTVIEPRAGWLAGERLPGVSLVEDWPDRALEALAPDWRTAVVTLSHDPKLDDPALHIALRSPAFYVGALGSRRTDAARRERLREAGLSEQELCRLHAPVGLAIGARSPAEIAVAILAEVIQQRHLA
jgi:xanthine dehydrogenase accessory factor